MDEQTKDRIAHLGDMCELAMFIGNERSLAGDFAGAADAYEYAELDSARAFALAEGRA